jgi:hypothetical protein
MKRELPSGDHDIAAWIDGELPPDAAAAVAQAAMADPGLAAAADRIRRLDDLVRQAVTPAEALPADLLVQLGLQDAAPVVDLAAARAARQAAPAPVITARRWPMMRMAAQVLLVAGLGIVVAVWQMPGTAPNAAYRTLSNGAAPSAANGLVMFAPGVDAATAGAIVSAAGGRLLATPNAAGAWQLRLPAGRRDAALAALRNDPRVRLAEPLDGSPS